MATSISMSIGYISGALYTGDKADAWDELKGSVNALAAQNKDTRWERELSAMYGTNLTLLKTLQPYINIYFENMGNPLLIDNDSQTIWISVSGNTESQRYKMIIGMAFCRIIMFTLNRKGIPVNINIE